MFQTTLFLLAWYSLTTTLFQAVQSDVFLSDCKSFFQDKLPEKVRKAIEDLRKVLF